MLNKELYNLNIQKDNNNLDTMIDSIENNFLQYFKDNSNLKSVTIGISGGIDSALIALLAHNIINKHKKKIKIIGCSLPIESNTKAEQQRAILIGESFCDNFHIKDLSKEYKVLKDMRSYKVKDTKNEKIRCGNIKARLRMIYLYDLASKNNGLVLSTDNFTEYLLGFWTLHGDVGDYGMVQNLWKTEVYAITNFIIELKEIKLKTLNYSLYLNNKETIKIKKDIKRIQKQIKALKLCVKAIPTDGLGITNSDLDQLRVTSYREADKILYGYLMNNSRHLIIHPIIKRHLTSNFKRNNPYNINRKLLLSSFKYLK